MKQVLLGVSLLIGLSGCVSLSGLDAASSFTCPKASGVACESMTTIYERGQAGTLPAQVKSGAVDSTSTAKKPAQPAATLMPLASQTLGASMPIVQTKAVPSVPLRTNAKVLRIWVNAWEDSEGDLHDQQFVYVTLNQGKWLLDHTRQRIAEPYGPVRAPSAPTAKQDKNASALLPQRKGNQLEEVRRQLGIIEPKAADLP